MKKVYIKALRRTVYDDLLSEYENPIEHACDMTIGQVFEVENGIRPENFCSEAWKICLPFVTTLANGGKDFFDGWMKNKYSAMVSCNDGFRPLTFYIWTDETSENAQSEKLIFNPDQIGQKAQQLFMQGYNCTQAVVLAYSDYLSIAKDTLLSIASPFGGGMGRLREVCGAVSGAIMVIGLLYGYSTPETGEIKKQLYSKVQEFAKQIEQQYGSIVCREMLKKDVKHDSPEAEARTPEFYKTRPCVRIIGSVATELAKLINEQNKY